MTSAPRSRPTCAKGSPRRPRSFRRSGSTTNADRSCSTRSRGSPSTTRRAASARSSSNTPVTSRPRPTPTRWSNWGPEPRRRRACCWTRWHVVEPCGDSYRSTSAKRHCAKPRPPLRRTTTSKSTLLSVTSSTISSRSRATAPAASSRFSVARSAICSPRSARSFSPASPPASTGETLFCSGPISSRMWDGSSARTTTRRA